MLKSAKTKNVVFLCVLLLFSLLTFAIIWTAHLLFFFLVAIARNTHRQIVTFQRCCIAKSNLRTVWRICLRYILDVAELSVPLSDACAHVPLNNQAVVWKLGALRFSDMVAGQIVCS